MQLIKAYNKLYKKFGPQDWWPVLSKGKKQQKFEICLGAILTQNTNWQNVEKAILSLYKGKLFSPEKISEIRDQRLGKLIKPSGYYRIKAKKLKAFSKMLIKDFNGDIDKLFKLPLNKAREKLLDTWGIGPETADSMLLYAGKRQIFVIDAYTVRLAKCLGIKKLDYDSLQKHFMQNLPKSAKLYNEFHALIVRLGKDYCRAKPLCEECLIKTLQ